MKKTLFTSILLASSTFVFAQITDPAPYCTPSFMFAYNMAKQITIDGHTKFFGAEGGFAGPAAGKDGYQYFNTEVFPTLPTGVPKKFIIDFYSVNDGEPIHFALWIDLNQNNIFEASELLIQNSNTIKKALGVFADPDDKISFDVTIPTTATLGKTRARLMRGGNPASLYVYTGAYVMDPCGYTTAVFNYGCIYDFDITIGVAGPKKFPPKANFIVNTLVGTTTTAFTFTDKSTDTPSQRLWTFTPFAVNYEAGTDSTSINPRVQFKIPGVYTAKLVVSNADGKDSMTRKNFISVSKATGIKDVNGNIVDFNVYPNPAKDFFMVDKAFIGLDLQIINAQGKLVQSGKLTNNKVEIANLASGFYFVKVINGEDVFTQSISVSK